MKAEYFNNLVDTIHTQTKTFLNTIDPSEQFTKPAKAMAEAISATESLTGVKATAQTNARLTVTPDNNTNDYRVISFELSGMNTTPKLISASITMGTGDGNFSADLSDLRDKINGFSVFRISVNSCKVRYSNNVIFP